MNTLPLSMYKSHNRLLFKLNAVTGIHMEPHTQKPHTPVLTTVPSLVCQGEARSKLPDGDFWTGAVEGGASRVVRL